MTFILIKLRATAWTSATKSNIGAKIIYQDYCGGFLVMIIVEYTSKHYSSHSGPYIISGGCMVRSILGVPALGPAGITHGRRLHQPSSPKRSLCIQCCKDDMILHIYTTHNKRYNIHKYNNNTSNNSDLSINNRSNKSRNSG